MSGIEILSTGRQYLVGHPRFLASQHSNTVRGEGSIRQRIVPIGYSAGAADRYPPRPTDGQICARVEVEVWEPWTGSVSGARTVTTPTTAPIDSVRLSAGFDRWPLGGPPVSVWVGGLPDLDDVTVRISDVATDLVLVLFRRRQELRTPCAPFGVHGVDVRDPDVEEAADAVGVAGVSRVTVGLSSVGPPPTLMMM